MKKSLLTIALCSALLGASCASGSAKSSEADVASADSIATVYFVKDITPENLLKIYQALGEDVIGKKVAVKISTGESNKSHQLDPALIAPLVQSVEGTIVECNTAYQGNRSDTEKHWETIREHGYMDIAPCDIMDAEGDTIIPAKGLTMHIDHDIVGKHLVNYDYMLVLSHFKGHAMGGFGGALKNISIGVASRDGKAWIHSAGATDTADSLWTNLAEQDKFIEAMADASNAVINYFGADNMAYINVANNLSVDCDCDGNPAEPKMHDLGILASKDPVALDRACVDMVFNADSTSGNADLIERINSRHGAHILPTAESEGLGSQKYKIVEL